MIAPPRGARDPGAYALGERVPSRVAEPADAAALAAVLREANAAREAIVLHGGGTLQAAANVPSRYDIAILTRRLDTVHAYDHRDLTIGAGAGMTVESLVRTLAEHGQFVPLDAPLAADATLGGTLSAGWLGPRRAAYGAPRDLLIGATVALADGSLASSGGMVVKNVTGYDMGKLYVGSHGTLGAIVRANFKLLTAPPARRLAVSPFDPELRDRLVAHARALALQPVALLVLDAAFVPRELGAPATVPAIVALFEGSDALVSRALREYRSALGAAGIAETRILDRGDADRGFHAVLDAYVAPCGDLSLTLVARGRPSDAEARVARARAVLAPFADEAPSCTAACIADLLTGDVVVRLAQQSAPDAARLGAATAAVRNALGGGRRIAAGPRAVALAAAWPSTPSTIGTMRALKERFDPAGVLAPGRFVGGI